MATYSTGITATWGSYTFGEVTGLSWQYGGTPTDRLDNVSTHWASDVGSVSITCLGSAGISTALHGQRQALTISGGGCTLTTPAIYESVAVSAERNGVTQYTVTLKILDA